MWGGLCCGVVSRPPHLSGKEVCDVQISAISERMGGSGDRPQLARFHRTQPATDNRAAKHHSGDNRMIRVLATIELAEGRRDDFLAEFAKIVPTVLEETGCLEYGPMVDIPTSIGAQACIRKNVATVVEKWESIEALEAHLVAPHMIEYRKKVKDMVTGTELRILKPA